jgi:hypothetical protein
MKKLYFGDTPVGREGMFSMFSYSLHPRCSYNNFTDNEVVDTYIDMLFS